MKQLKKYETPEMEITLLENADVICTSGDDEPTGPAGNEGDFGDMWDN